MKKAITILVWAVFLMGAYLFIKGPSDEEIKIIAQQRLKYEFNGEVRSAINNRGDIKLILMDKSVYSIPTSRNKKYKPTLLSEFLKKGDSIAKRSFNDTLWVTRNGQRYYYGLP